jgi:hypothetical protein
MFAGTKQSDQSDSGAIPQVALASVESQPAESLSLTESELSREEAISLIQTNGVPLAPRQNVSYYCENVADCFYGSVRNMTALLNVSVQLYTKICALESRHRIAELYEIASAVGFAEGYNSNVPLTKYVTDEINTLSTYKGLKFSGYLLELLASYKDNNVRQKVVDRLWLALSDELDDIIKKTNLPFFLRRNVWTLLQNIRMINILRTSFGDDCDLCIPTTWKFVSNLWTLTGNTNNVQIIKPANFKGEVTNKVDITPENFINGGLVYTFWGTENLATMKGNSVVLFNGFLSNKLAFEYTLNRGNGEVVHQLKVAGNVIPIRSGTTCSTYFFVTIAVQKACEKYNFHISIRFLGSNRRLSEFKEIYADEMEFTSFNFNKDVTFNNHLFTNTKYHADHEPYYMSYTSDNNLLKLLLERAVCNNHNGKCKYSDLDKCYICNQPFAQNQGNCVNPCPDGTYKSKNANCRPCAPQCQTCAGPKNGNCITCAKSLLMNNGKCVVTCPDNMAANKNRQCVKCDEHCDVCRSLTTCGKCSAGYFLKDGRCVPNCGLGFFHAYTPNVCNICPTGCAECKGAKQCTVCETGFFLKDGVCVKNCGDRFYGNTKTNTCSPCSFGCQTCNNAKTCLTCVTGLIYYKKTQNCKEQCPEREVKIKGVCVKCTDANCVRCSALNVNHCRKCDKSHLLKNNKCVTNCGEGYYSTPNRHCLPCPKLCKTCTKDKCLQCFQKNVVFRDTTCVSQCPDGYVTSGNVCVKCDDPTSCRKCKTDELSTCTLCYKNQVLYSGKCINNCPPTFYNKGGVCVPCQKGCELCKNKYSCQRCVKNFFLKNKVCVDCCGSGYTDSNRECKKCTVPGCDVCNAGTLGKCEKCVQNKFLYNNECLNVCPLGTYANPNGTCERCQDGCALCNNKNTCQRCVIGKVLQGTQCQSGCNDGFINISGVCTQCVNPRCKKCQVNNLGYCTECALGSFRFKGDCLKVCPDGHFPENGTCVPCVSPCVECLNRKTCTKCVANFFVVNGKCTDQCPNKQANQSGVCVPCADKYCTKCSPGDVTTCLVCDPGFYRHQGKCLKECHKGFYSSEGACHPCIKGCEVCKNDTTCLKCVPHIFLHNSYCVSPCPSGTVEIAGKCVNCNPTCKTCSPTNINLCTTCNSPYKLFNGKCLSACPEGTFSNESNVCKPCGVDKCSKCSVGNTCTRCLNGYVLLNNKCIPEPCPAGYVVNPITNTCVACQVSNCATCPLNDLQTCKTCVYPNILLNNNECVATCPSGYYKDSLTQKCLPCSSNCKSCSDSSNCVVCNSNYFLLNAKCRPECPNGYTTNNGKCVRCETKNCSSCTPNGKTCTECNAPFVLNNNQCTKECPEGRWSLLRNCVDCPFGCQDCCDGSRCDHCLPGKTLTETGKCVDDCPERNVSVNGKCFKCLTDANCLKCNGQNLKECVSCKSGFVLKNNLCVRECGSGFVNLSGKCAPCPGRCSVCSHPSRCQVCDNNYFLIKGKCEPTCPDGFAPINGRCSRCDPKCIKCKNNKCYLCENGYLLHNGNCHNQCPKGTFEKAGSCLNCGKNCLNCVSPSTCKVCQNGFFLHNGSCVEVCPTGTAQVSGNCLPCGKNCLTCNPLNVKECTKCVKDSFLHNGVCQPNCPLGYFPRNGGCHPCLNGCEVCTNEKQCERCKNPLLLNAEKTTCTSTCLPGNLSRGYRCEQCRIPGCRLCSVSPNICDQCTLPLVLFNNKCVKLCPAKKFYRTKNELDCKPCPPGCHTCAYDRCISCSKGYKLQGDKCVNVCPVGQIKVNGKCQQCLNPNCSNCDSSKKKCLQCKPGFVLDVENGVTDCLSCCKEGWFNKKGTCKECVPFCKTCFNSRECSVCREGYVKQNGQCVRRCARGYVQKLLNCEKCVDANCIRCRPDNKAVCSRCENGYSLKGDNCVPNCGLGYYQLKMKNGLSRCIPCDKNCNECTGHLNCQVCANGFFLKQGSCVQKCDVGFTLNPLTNTCVECLSKQCVKCDINNRGTCLTCLPGYFLQDSQCVQKCNVGYRAINNVCQPCDNVHCISCSAGVTKCDKCQVPFVVLGGSCVLQCPIGMVELNGVCRKCDDPNCIICHPERTDKCSVCKEGYLNDIHRKCKHECPVGTYSFMGTKCLPCPNNCSKCVNATTCLECNTGFFFNKNKKCTDNCAIGTVKVKGKCIPCKDTNCKKCKSTNVGLCDACKTGFLTYKDKCYKTCPEGSFQIATTCKKCLPNCASCKTTDTCEKCFPVFVSYGKWCVRRCPDGYKPLNGKCVKCPSFETVKRCPNPPKQVVCRENSFRLGNTCVYSCPKGYHAEADRVCHPCPKFCVECNNTKTCNKCDATHVLLNNNCLEKCPKNTVNVLGVCQRCSSFKCEECRPQNLQYCRRCIKPLLNHYGKCVKYCPVGTFKEGNRCIQCDETCLECTSKEDCIKCKPQFLMKKKRCYSKCEIGEVMVNNVCIACQDPNCNACSSLNINKCLHCKPGFKFILGKCVQECPRGFFLNPFDNNSCQACSRHCDACDEKTCTKCENGFYPFAKDPRNCVPCRGNRYVVEKGQCTKCKPGFCLKCVAGNSQKCEVCHVSTFLVNGQCLNTCPAGTFRSRNQCLPCASNCLSCYDNEHCQVCKPPLILHNQVCIAKCPTGYNYNKVANRCVRCPENCIECTKDSKTCTKCATPYILFSNACHKNCPEGTYISNGKCLPCKAGCLSCTAHSCLKCEVGLLPKGSECVKVCGPGFFDNKVKCVPCTDSNCQVCSPENICKSCKAPYFLNFNGQCVKECKAGSYRNAVKNKCVECDKTCATCSGPGKCLTCIPGLFLHNSKCIKQCPDGYSPLAGKCAACQQPNCKLCSNDVKICTECNKNFSVLNGACVPNCPKGRFAVKGNCKKCNRKCIDCKEYNACVKCRPEFELIKGMCVSPCAAGQVLINEKCVSCSDKNCQNCLTNVNKCVDCKKPFVLYENTCRTACPDNYYADKNRNCVKCENGCELCNGKNICKRCADGFYLHNDQCVKQCPIRTWGECKERVCKNCHNACMVCADSTSTNCSRCNKGFYLDGRSCKPDGECSRGTFPNPVTRKCCPCPIKFCLTCLNYNTCSKCIPGYELNKNGGCSEAKRFINVIPSAPRLVSQITSRLLAKSELMKFAENFNGLGIGSETVTYSFFLRRITEFTTETTVFRTSSTLPSAILSFYINNEICYVKINFSSYKVGDCSYQNLYSWKFFSLTLEKNGATSTLHATTQNNNQLKENTVTLSLPSNEFWVNRHSLFKLNTPSKSNAVELSNFNLFDYAPSKNETATFFSNKPSNCDYACLDCTNKCQVCPGNTLPNADGLCPTTYVPIFRDLEVLLTPLNMPLRDILTKRLDSYNYGLLLWFHSINNNTDYTVGSLHYPYTPSVTLITVRSVNHQLQVLVNKQVFTVAPLSNNEWYQIGVFVTNGKATITLQPRLGNPSSVTHNLNANIRLLTEDASFGNNLFFGSIFDVRVYINGLPTINEIEEHFNRLRCGPNCKVCGKNMRCTRCDPKFALSKNFRCFSTDVGNNYLLLDKYSFFNKEVYTVDVPTVLLRKPFSLSFWYRKKIHSVPNVPPQEYFNVLSYVPLGSSNTVFPLIQEKIYPVTSYKSDFLLGGDCGQSTTFTENFSNEVYSWIHFVLNFNPQQKLVSFYVQNDNKVNFVGNFTYDAARFVFGDRNGLDMNFEIGNAYVYEKPITVDNLATVQTYQPRDCDPACLKCNYLTGQCSECAFPTLGIVNRCKNLLKGYVSAYTYNQQVVGPTTKRLFSVDLRTVFSRDVNSLEYSVIGYFRLFDFTPFNKFQNNKFVLFTLTNRNDEKKSPSNYLMSLQLETVNGGLRLLWVNNDHNNVVQNEVNINLKPDTWMFVYATINVVQKRLNYVLLVENQGETPVYGVVQFNNFPEKLQERAKLELFGLPSTLPNNYKTVNGQFLHFYLSPNFGWNPSIVDKFRKSYPLPKDPKCAADCKKCIYDFYRQINVCLKCNAGYTVKNQRCTKVVNSDYIIFSDQFNTNLLPPRADFTIPRSHDSIEKNTLAFYFRRNFVPRDWTGNRVILRAGQLSVSLQVNQGSSASLTFDVQGVTNNIALTTVDSQLNDDYFWNLVLILYTPNSVKVIVKNESGTLIGTKQISFNNSRLKIQTLSFNSLQNEVSIYGPHLLFNYFYLEPLFKFPQLDCSIDCNVCVADKCEDCQYGFSPNSRCLNRPIKKPAFAVSNKELYGNRVYLREFLGDNRFLRSNSWTVTFTFESSVDINNFSGRTLFRLQNTQTNNYNPNLINDNLFTLKFHENRSFFLSANTRHYQSQIKSAEGWTSRSLKSNISNNKFFVAITVDDDTNLIHLFVYNSESNYLTQTFSYEGVLDNLVNTGTLVFGEGFGVGHDTTRVIFDNLRFYYENALTFTHFVDHYRRIMAPYQPACNLSSRSTCERCTSGVLINKGNKKFCSPNSNAYNWDLNHVRAFNELNQNHTVLTPILNPEKLDSFTFSFWYRRISYNNQAHKLVSVGGVVLIHYENNNLYINVEGFNCGVVGSIRIPKIYGKTNGLDWIHITVAVNLRTKTFEVYTHNTGDLHNRYSKASANVPAWGNLKKLNLTWSLDHTGCPFTTYSFEVSSFVYVPNHIPVDSLEVELYRIRKPVNCESRCQGRCAPDLICPSKLQFNKQFSLPNQGYNAKSPVALYRNITNFISKTPFSYPLFREYLIGFDINLRFLHTSNYTANKYTLVNMINEVVNCSHTQNHVVTDNHFKYGIFSVELRPETLRFFMGGSQANSYASYYDFNFKELKNVDTVRVSFYVNSDRNYGKIILHLDDLAASYTIATVYTPQPITRDTMVYTHPALNNLRINVHNPRFNFDFYKNILPKGYNVLHNSALCRSKTNCDKCSIIADTPTIFCQKCSNGFKMINNMCLKEASFQK